MKDSIKQLIPDSIFLYILLRKKLGYKSNLFRPRTFNEKIQWLKLHDRKAIYPKMVDKIEVKSYVSGLLGEEYVIPTLGVWERFEDIDFEALPARFVLKCSHDSGSVIIIKDKNRIDTVAIKKQIQNSLGKNFYTIGREWPYKNIKPRIIAERYLEDSEHNEPVDYKFMCFNGIVKCCFVCSGRFSDEGLKVTFFDRKWNRLPFERHYPSCKEEIPKPKCLDEMIEISEKLSSGIPFVRIDLYEVEGKVYFGEYTFYPGSGFEEFIPEEWDYILGDWLRIDQLEKNVD